MEPDNASAETLCRDPDYSKIVSIELDCLADHIRISREASLPEAVADDHHRMGPRSAIFIRREGAPLRSGHAQHVEVISRHERSSDTFVLPISTQQVEGSKIVHSQPGEDFIAIAIVFVIGVRDRTCAIT